MSNRDVIKSSEGSASCEQDAFANIEREENNRKGSIRKPSIYETGLAVLVLLVGIATAYTTFTSYVANERIVRIHEQVDGAMELIKNIETVHGARESYEGLAEGLIISTGLLPEGFSVYGDAYIMHGWGDITIPTAESPDSFSLAFINVPAKACVGFASNLAPLATNIYVDEGNTLTDFGPSLKHDDGRLKLTDLQQRCAESNIPGSSHKRVTLVFSGDLNRSLAPE